MIDFLVWFWPIGVGIVEGLAIVFILWKVRDQRARHRALGVETAAALAMHQDTLASLDARLRVLGSRTSGDVPVPTAEEVMTGRWQR
jgi:hypothetical protein